MEFIETKNSLDFKLQFDPECSIKIQAKKDRTA